MHSIKTLMQRIEPKSEVFYVIELICILVVIYWSTNVHILHLILLYSLLVLICQCFLTLNVSFFKILRISFLLQNLVLISQIHIYLLPNLWIQLSKHHRVLGNGNFWNQCFSCFFLLIFITIIFIFLSLFPCQLLRLLPFHKFRKLLFNPE